MNLCINDFSDLEENFFPRSWQDPSTPYPLQIDEIEPCMHLQQKRIRTSPGYFAYFHNKKGNKVKKEYLRLQLIRGHNRLINNALKNKIPRKTLNKIKKTNTKQMKKWEIFKSFSEECIRPIHLSREIDLNCYKSFNNKYCYQYFLDHTIRKSFLLYCDVILCDDEPEELCEKFKMFCCEEKNQHKKNCKEKWDKIKMFIRKEMISELRVGESLIS